MLAEFAGGTLMQTSIHGKIPFDGTVYAGTDSNGNPMAIATNPGKTAILLKMDYPPLFGDVEAAFLQSDDNAAILENEYRRFSKSVAFDHDGLLLAPQTIVQIRRIIHKP